MSLIFLSKAFPQSYWLINSFSDWQVKGGIAEADGRLLAGDQILSVNGEDLKNATQDVAAAVLKVNYIARTNFPYLPKINEFTEPINVYEDRAHFILTYRFLFSAPLVELFLKLLGWSTVPVPGRRPWAVCPTYTLEPNQWAVWKISRSMSHSVSTLKHDSLELSFTANTFSSTITTICLVIQLSPLNDSVTYYFVCWINQVLQTLSRCIN